MFKTKFTLLDIEWNQLFEYWSRVKPCEGEFIYVELHECYYKVLKVIHSIKKPMQTILVVEKVKNVT